ncbi:MAG: hypothetical protein RPR91_03070 [Colwellia sp.]
MSFIGLFGLSQGSYASLTEQELEAVRDASSVFNLDACLLYALQVGEGGTTGVDKVHNNGSIDTGISQINKGGVWMRLLKEKFGISHESIRDNGPINILSSGYILRTELNRTHDIVLALSSYHRGFGKRYSKSGLQYSNRILNIYKNISVKRICKSLIT